MTGRRFLSSATCVSLILLPIVLAAAGPDILHHQANIVIDLGAHQVSITDQITLPAGLDHLLLGEDLQVEALAGPSGAVSPQEAITKTVLEETPYQKVDLDRLGLTAGGTLKISASAVYFQSVDEVEFSRENVGGEITATISEEGIYLSAGAGWLAWHPDLMATHDLHFNTPAGYETVTQGQRTQHETKSDRLLTRWTTPHPSDGLTLVANRYHVYEEAVTDQITSYVFLLEEDTRLRDTYQERTRTYLDMYTQMIGPYPYSKFATVENWFPTGYGMPSYTLLGGQVLRLPFIPYTSFGHEIAHNWWGNSVFVDIEQGNWCEGLTVFCADYHYKELESSEAAREYRRTLLKDYAAYVSDDAKDFPLTEFVSRHSGATRAVGYGKSMLVFHMIDRAIGREAFTAGLQQVYRDKLFQQAAWSDFLAAFSQVSGQDLAAFGEQWLTRTGAPIIAVDKVEFGKDDVSFRLRQGAPPYNLPVPIVLTTAAGAQEHIVTLDKMGDTYQLPVAGVRRLAIDPDYNLFRQMAPQEIEPTLSQVLADDAPSVIMCDPEPDMLAAGQAFDEAFCQEPFHYFDSQGKMPVDYDPGTGHANVVINPSAELAQLLSRPELTIFGSTLQMDGKRYSLDEYDLVYAVNDPHDPQMTDLVIYCHAPERLAALGRRLGHYGKYSWLLLPKGTGRALRGNWQPVGSPLVVEKN